MSEQALAGPSLAENHRREQDVYYLACRNSPGFCKLYEIDTWQRLGGGKSGCVAMVRSRVRRGFVVAKVLEHGGEATLTRLADELRVVDQIVSEYVVRVFGAHEAEGLVWIEMEYVEGPTLREVQDRLRDEGRWFSSAEAALLGLEICRGLQAIHGAGAIHRDIKPENVILPSASRVKAKIVDFGIARFMDKDRLTHTGEFKGTPEYSPPEYFKSRKPGDPAPRFGPEVDVYSLGVLLYQVFTGAKPFEAAGTHEIARAHLQVAPTPPQQLKPELPRELCATLLAMLSKKPEQRPSVERVVQVLERLDAEGTRLPRHFGSRSARLRRLGLAAAGVCALAVLAALPSRDAARSPVDGPASPPAVHPAQASPAAERNAAAGASVAETQPANSATVSPRPFAVVLDGEALVLTNNTGAPATGFSLVLLGGGGTRHHAVAVDETVEAGGTLTVPFAFFEPPPGEGMPIRQVDMTVARSQTGRLTLSVPLQQ